MDESCRLTNGVYGGWWERHVGLIDMETSRKKGIYCHTAEAKYKTPHVDTKRQIPTQEGLNGERRTLCEIGMGALA